jgi:hypothetical protein
MAARVGHISNKGTTGMKTVIELLLLTLLVTCLPLAAILTHAWPNLAAGFFTTAAGVFAVTSVWGFIARIRG